MSNKKTNDKSNIENKNETIDTLKNRMKKNEWKDIKKNPIFILVCLSILVGIYLLIIVIINSRSVEEVITTITEFAVMGGFGLISICIIFFLFNKRVREEYAPTKKLELKNTNEEEEAFVENIFSDLGIEKAIDTIIANTKITQKISKTRIFFELILGIVISSIICWIEIMFLFSKLDESIISLITTAILFFSVLISLILFRRNHKIVAGVIFGIVCLPVAAVMTFVGGCMLTWFRAS